MPTNTYKFLTDGLFYRQKTKEFKTYLLLLLRHQSIVPNLLSVEQKRSPDILPESRAFKNLSPHIFPTTRAEICCKVPIKSPHSPTSARGPLPDGKYITLGSRDMKHRYFEFVICSSLTENIFVTYY